MIESILSFNFSDKKIFPDTKEGYIYIFLWDTLGERKAGPTRYRVIAISISRKNGKKGGAARDSRNGFDIGPTKNGSMWRESERRGDHRQLSRVIDRREIRPEISRSLSRFFPPLPSHSFQTFFLSLLRFEPRKGKERIGIIYIIALQ